MFLVGIPLGLISNTYFPIDHRGAILDAAMQANPIYHLAETYRTLLLGHGPDMHVAWLLGTALVWLLVFSTAAHGLVQRRVRQD